MIIEQQSMEKNQALASRVLSYMIMDKEVCDAAWRRYKASELKSIYFGGYEKRIFQWIIQYYEQTGRCPKTGILQIWERKKKAFKRKEQRELIEQMLQTLSSDFEYFEDDGVDPKDVIVYDIPNLIRENEIQLRMTKIEKLISDGEYDKAAEIMRQIPDIDNDETEDENMGTIMPMTFSDIDKSASAGGLEAEVAYQFDGDLGRMIGPLRKGWLVAVTGKEKAGKSFLLDEIGYDAALYQGKKVLKINLELSETLQRSRTQKRISLTCDPHQAGRIIYPVLDCENNQYGSCRIPHMAKILKRKGPLISGPNEIASFEDRRSWTVCTDCHNNPKVRRNAHKTKRFIPCIWFDRSRVRELKPRYVKRALRGHRKASLENFRIRCFPRFSKTFEEIKSYILRYIEKMQWMPDIIILDYVDIFANSGQSSDENMRHEVDRKWKQASQLAGELDCLVINADQATKAGRSQYQLDQMSTSESKTKDAHLDIRLALNQTDTEKKLGIARIGILFHRHQEFAILNEVLVTQRLATSQPILENTRIYEKEKKYSVIQENL
jgi:replicative DNA helicase